MSKCEEEHYVIGDDMTNPHYGVYYYVALYHTGHNYVPSKPTGLTLTSSKMMVQHFGDTDTKQTINYEDHKLLSCEKLKQ